MKQAMILAAGLSTRLKPPHYVRTSDLPSDVRTMQQIDHDAWEYAAKNGLI